MGGVTGMRRLNMNSSRLVSASAGTTLDSGIHGESGHGQHYQRIIATEFQTGGVPGRGAVGPGKLNNICRLRRIGCEIPVLDEAELDRCGCPKIVPIPVVKVTFTDTQLQPTKIATEFGLSREVLKAGRSGRAAILIGIARHTADESGRRSRVPGDGGGRRVAGGHLERVTSSGVVSCRRWRTIWRNYSRTCRTGGPGSAGVCQSGEGALWLRKSGAEAFADANHGGRQVGGAPLLISAAAGNGDPDRR